ncbi:MAG: hypothetical protein HQK50_08315 [Oligoflexia bacterium]|nr:hypothetical protein [Oligoflexia bacterium]
MKKIFIFGGINIDIVAKKESFSKETSNPATIDISLGGVGYNIFQGIRGKRKHFITSIGKDFFTPHLEKALTKGPGKTSYKVCKKFSNGKYLALMESGSLLYGASDNSAIESGFDKRFLKQETARIKKGSIVILEANLLPVTISKIIKDLHSSPKSKNTKIIFETVSTFKALRSKKALKNLFLLTPTLEELQALLPSAVINDNKIFAYMKKNKIKNILLTL